jgi:hypothetical protein
MREKHIDGLKKLNLPLSGRVVGVGVAHQAAGADMLREAKVGHPLELDLALLS